MTIQICRLLPLFNFERLDELCLRIGHPVKSYDHSTLSRASVVQFRASRWVMSANRTSGEKLWPFEFLECCWCSISIVSILYVLKSDIGVKCYDHSNLSRVSVFQFRASRWVMSPNRTSVWNVMTIQICRLLPLFNFERLDELCLRIGHPVKSYDHSTLSRASVVQFRASRYIISPNRSSVWKVRTIQISRELLLFNF